MVHYIEKETVKDWLHCDDDAFNRILSDENMVLRTSSSEPYNGYHSVDVHRMIMKQNVDNKGHVMSLKQLLLWSRFYDKLHGINHFERSENVKPIFNDMIRLVDMTDMGCDISIDYMQVLIKWYLETISRLFDDYDIQNSEINLSHNETICLPDLSIINHKEVLESFVQSLKDFNFYRALGVVKMYQFHHICRDEPLVHAFLKDVTRYLNAVTNICITIGRYKSSAPIMIHIEPIQQWAKEMIQILFNVTERGEVM